MNTPLIIRSTEKLDTICIRLARPADQDARRAELIEAFKAMCTDIGKLATSYARPDWHHLQVRMHDLRWAAVQADEARVATFAQVGTEAALGTSLHAFAAVLGFVLADAETAPVDGFDDDAAMAAVEGARIAAE